MATPKTILIGDELAAGLDKALRKLPGVLPLWTIAVPGWPIVPFAIDEAIDKIKKIEAGWSDKGGADAPTNVVVSAGRMEALTEPDDADQKDLDGLYHDTKRTVDSLRGAGFNVFWVLPPAITGERKARGVIARALQDEGVRVLDASQIAAETKATRGKLAPADLQSDAYDVIAKRLKASVPVGTSPFSNIVLPAPSAADTLAEKARFVFNAAVSSVSAWPTPAKVAGGVAVAAAVIGGVYAVAGRKKGSQHG